jgi:D-serine dehydratase
METQFSLATFSGLTKGLPLNLESIALSEIGAKGWNILREDVPLPAAILRSSALDQNSKIMREFLDSSSAWLCPHGKTTMSPQLFRRQMDDGAWGLTVATPQEIRVARHFGHKRILLANQLIGRPAIRYVLDELRDDPEFDFYCLVDSVDGVHQLVNQIRVHEVRRPVQVLLEIGSAGQRCGCRTQEEALRVALAVRDTDSKLVLRGIEGFEGLFQFQAQPGQDNPVTDFLKFLLEIARQIEKEQLFSGGEILLTAGGSNYFDLVTKAFRSAALTTRFQVILRSGCYLIHDSGWCARVERERQDRMKETGNSLPKAEAALEVWTYVQSVPEPTLAILTAGRRDCGHDAGFPVPLKWFREGLHTKPVALGPEYVITALSDQHAHMRIPAGNILKVGDLVGLGISHPCTTFDKWKLLFMVDDDYNVTSAIETYF